MRSDEKARIPDLRTPFNLNEMNNCVIEIAKKAGRTYITPEDVGAARQSHPVDQVRKDVLQVLACVTEHRAEDVALCAFLAWRD